MTARRLLLTAIAVGVCVAPRIPAQTEQPRQPIFRTGANLVRVDVTVIDRRGNPVNALTADDFQIEEDGVPQAIQTFKFVEASGQRVEGDDRSLAILSRSDVEMEAARDDVRVVVIFWDEYYIGQMDSAIRARRFLSSFVQSEVAPLDLVAIVDEYTPSDMIPFTRNRRELIDQIRRLRGRRGIYTPPRNLAEEAHLAVGNIERLRTEVTISALEAMAVRLGGLREARKAIVFVSEGPSGLGRDWYTRLQTLSRAANDANTAIYTVDPRGLTSRPANDILAEIAINTDGRAILRSNAPEQHLGQVFRHLSAYYLLGYESTQRPQDGRFHRIEVKVPRRGVEVLARKGYWAPKAGDVDRARESAAASEAPPEVRKALTALVAPRIVNEVDLWIGTGRGLDGGAEVTLTWALRARSQPSRQAPAAVSIAATGSDGEICFEGPVGPQPVRFGAPPGPLRVRVAYHDGAGERIGTETREVAVPDFTAAPLGIGTPIVFRASPGAARQQSSAGPVPGREFIRTDRLLMRFEVYGAQAGAAAVSAKFLDRTGRVRVELAAKPAGNGTYEVDLPLSFAAPGEYLVAVGAVSGAEKVEALVPLRIVNP